MALTSDVGLVANYFSVAASTASASYRTPVGSSAFLGRMFGLKSYSHCESCDPRAFLAVYGCRELGYGSGSVRSSVVSGVPHSPGRDLADDRQL